MLTALATFLTILSALIVGVAAGMATTRAFLHVFFLRRMKPQTVGLETARISAQAS